MPRPTARRCRRPPPRPRPPPPAAALPSLPTGWADRAPLPAAATGPAAAGYYGFLGTPSAAVVAAHVDTSGAKDVALFLVRVADGRGEWAVARRHRHFEAMHRALREAVPGYRLRPPTKRSLLGGVSHAPEAVEERRRGLDAFLWKVLADPSLACRREVWDFDFCYLSVLSVGGCGLLALSGFAFSSSGLLHLCLYFIYSSLLLVIKKMHRETCELSL